MDPNKLKSPSYGNSDKGRYFFDVNEGMGIKDTKKVKTYGPYESAKMANHIRNNHVPLESGQRAGLPYVQELTEKYQKAASNRPMFDSILSSTAEMTGARAQSNFKNPSTAIEKVGRKNEEEPKRDYKLDDVNDIGRGRLTYPDVNSLKKALPVLKEQIKSAGLKITDEEDMFDHPKKNGYQAYHIDVKFPNGETQEIQLHTVNSLAASLATHQMKSQFGDQPPADIGNQEQAVNSAVQSLPPQQAAGVAQHIESQNAPQQQAAQISALNLLNGNGNPSPNALNAAKTLQMRQHYGV